MPSSQGPAQASEVKPPEVKPPDTASSHTATSEPPVSANFRMRSPAPDQCVFLPTERMPRHRELGLDGPSKFATSCPPVIKAVWGLGMTYCCGVLVRDGLVMIADTRTNAGLDNVSTFRKLHIFSKPGDRIMAIASAGNLAISQSVLSTLTEGIEDPTTGDVETLMNAPTMFQAAQRIGRAIRLVHATEGPALRSEDVSFDVSFLFGGQIKGSRMRLFMVYTAGNV